MWFYKSGESGQWENTEKPTRTLFLETDTPGFGSWLSPYNLGNLGQFAFLNLSFLICIMGKTRMPNLRGESIIQCLYTA